MHSIPVQRRKNIPPHQGTPRGFPSPEGLVQAAQPQAAPRRITFSAAGKAFIDEYVDIFRAAGPAQRRLIVDGILAAAAGLDAVLDSRHWTVHTVETRLKNEMKRRNQAAAAAAALNHA